jgi:spore coat polysaccharide biosynthesis protein SpsF (cytidylyltransferase family)
MKIVSIVQASMGSTRLPGKVMMPVAGKPLIARVIDVLSTVSLLDEIVLAISSNPIDDILADYAKDEGISLYRGDQHDVLQRYIGAAAKARADVIVRNCGDSPLLDRDVVSHVINGYIRNDYDYVSNTLQHTWPIGLDTEVLSFKALEVASLNAIDPLEREHVTVYHKRNTDLFSLFNVCALSSQKYPKIRLTVDTKEDYQLICEIYRELYDGSSIIGLSEVIELYHSNPDLFMLNEHITQFQVD